MNTARAQLNYLRMAPRKVRLVTDVIKRMPIGEAEVQLLMMKKRAAQTVLKLLRSAIANAKNKNLKTNTLVVDSIRVDQGPTLKRILPRAQGRATPIHKKTSHITLVLAESGKEYKPRFTISKPEKKTPTSRKASSGTVRKQSEPKPVLKEEKKGVSEEGFMRRIFRRKSV